MIFLKNWAIFKMKMMSSQVVFTTLILVSTIDLALGSVPLLLLGSVKNKDVETHSGLSRTNSTEFKQYLVKKVSGEKSPTKVIVFLEDDLSVEDFSWKDKNNLGHYPRMKDVVDAGLFNDFFPSVSLPLEAVHGLDQYRYVLKYFEGTDSLPAPDDWNIVWIIRLSNLEDRKKSLRSHDKFIVEMYNQILKTYDNVLILYTGIKSSWELQTKLQHSRKFQTTVDGPQTTWVRKRVLLVATNIPILKFQDFVFPFNSDKVVITEYPYKEIDFEIPLSLELRSLHNSTPFKVILFFYFISTPFTWKLVFIKFNYNNQEDEFLFPLFDICAPISRSWHSNLEVVFISNNTKNGHNRTMLTFDDMQVEFFLKDHISYFSPAVDVITFFTINIIQALFVVWILLMVSILGIIMLMDIKTHDQFDDMYSKPLMINVVE